MPRTIVPAQCLLADPSPQNRYAVPENKSGVLLRNGTFIAQNVLSADETIVRFSNAPSDPTLATVNVAQILFQPLSANLSRLLADGRPGVLLKNGDFLDGEFREFKQNQITLNSVLLGLKKVNRDQAVALLLHDPVSSPARFEICTRTGTRWFVNDLVLEKDHILAGDNALAGWKVSWSDLVDLQRRDNPGM